MRIPLRKALAESSDPFLEFPGFGMGLAGDFAVGVGMVSGLEMVAVTAGTMGCPVAAVVGVVAFFFPAQACS